MNDQRPWTTRTTTDHDEIREWAEARDAEPRRVTGADDGEHRDGEDVDLESLRIDFPKAEDDPNLEPVSWDAFFENFEDADLAFRYQDRKHDGEQSYYHRFVRRDVVPTVTAVTTDRETIRKWADEREATPAHVVGTAAAADEEVGVLRFGFTDEEAERVEDLLWDAFVDEQLEQLLWGEFFEKFERENLALERRREAEAETEVRAKTETGAEIETEVPGSYYRFVHREETGVADAVDEDVSVVAVGTERVATDTEAEISTEADAGTEADAEPEDDRDAADEQETDPARGSTAAGVPDEVLDSEPRPAAELTVGLVVDEIHEDAAGYDHWNKNDEYLVFRNDGDEPLALAGWTVENSDGKSYEFPDEFVLEPNRAVTLRSGSGTDTDRDLYWGSGRAVWKNTGDVLTVRTADGRRVIRESY